MENSAATPLTTLIISTDCFYPDIESLNIKDLVPDFESLTIKQIAERATDTRTPLSVAIETRKRDLTETFEASIRRARGIAESFISAAEDDPNNADFFLIYSIRAFAVAGKIRSRLNQELSRLDNHSRPARPGEITPDDIADARSFSVEQVLVDRGYQVTKTRLDCPLCSCQQAGKILSNGRYYCHHCKVSFDAIALVQRLDDIPFLSAVRQLIGK